MTTAQSEMSRTIKAVAEEVPFSREGEPVIGVSAAVINDNGVSEEPDTPSRWILVCRSLR